MAEFTYQWTNECRMNTIANGEEGEEIDLCAGNNFKKRRVKEGDTVYVIATWQGPVFLIGRMRVKKLLARKDWLKKNPGYSLWDGDEVIVGEKGTPMRTEFAIPPDVLRKLRFLDPKGQEKRLKMAVDGTLDNAQSIRSVRRLSPKSAELLDGLLDNS